MSFLDGTGERGTWVYDEKSRKFVPYVKPTPKQVAYVITDELEATRCHADDRVYTSKRKLLNAIKRSGSIEIGPGDEAPKAPSVPDPFGTDEDRHEMAMDVMNRLRWGDWKLTEEEKAIAKRDNERWNRKD